MPRKSSPPSRKKKTTKIGGGFGVSGVTATKRHWIYAASSVNNDTKSKRSDNDDSYEKYLHQRVQRILVRSIPSNYSYFQQCTTKKSDYFANGGGSAGEVTLGEFFEISYSFAKEGLFHSQRNNLTLFICFIFRLSLSRCAIFFNNNT